MKLQSFIYYQKNKKKTIKVEVCDTILKKFSGLMFRKNSNPLLFPFKKEKNLSIHSFFCKPFKAIWIDDKRRITQEKFIYNWRPFINGRGKYLLEIQIPRR
jgi:uncharacterized membrane protein (UPF0127 family)